MLKEEARRQGSPLSPRLRQELATYFREYMQVGLVWTPEEEARVRSTFIRWYFNDIPDMAHPLSNDDITGSRWDDMRGLPERVVDGKDALAVGQFPQIFAWCGVESAYLHVNWDDRCKPIWYPLPLSGKRKVRWDDSLQIKGGFQCISRDLDHDKDF